MDAKEELRNLLLATPTGENIKMIPDKQMNNLLNIIDETVSDLNLFHFNIGIDEVLMFFIKRIKNGYNYKYYTNDEIELMMKNISTNIKMDFLLRKVCI